MQLTRSILVLEGDTKYQMCYNGTLPGLLNKCETSKGFFCSTLPPEYGCTRSRQHACFDFHLCNTPQAIWIVFIVAVVLCVLLLASGCLWCCACCCCGRCCRNTCPRFAKLNAFVPPQHFYPVFVPSETSGSPWTITSMYPNLDHEIIASSEKSESVLRDEMVNDNELEGDKDKAKHRYRRRYRRRRSGIGILPEERYVGLAHGVSASPSLYSRADSDSRGFAGNSTSGMITSSEMDSSRSSAQPIKLEI